MRKLLFFWIFIINCGHSNSQNFNVAHHSYIDDVSNLLSFGSRHFYIERIQSSGFLDSTNFVGMSAGGNILFKVNLSFNEANRVIRAIRTFDNCVLILGNSNGCDFDSNPRNFICKVDTTGLIKFQAFNSILNSGSGFKDVVQHPDSSYYFVSDSSVYHYSKNGIFISKFTTGVAYPRCMTLSNSGDLLINGSNSGFAYVNALVSVSGSLINQQNGNYYIRLYTHPTLGYFGLGLMGNVERLSNSLVSTQSSTISLGPDIAVSAITFKSDSILFTGRYLLANAPLYGIMDQNLSQLYLSPPVYNNVYPTGITCSKNKVNVIAHATSTLSGIFWPTSLGFLSFYRFPLNGALVTTPDVGVTNAVVVGSGYIPGQNVCSFNLNVTVTNYSADTIKHFFLNSRIFQEICGFSQFHKHFTGTILPFGSLVVQTGTFMVKGYGPQNALPGSTFEMDVCLYTTIPNQHPDKNISNDGLCKPLTVTITDIDEQKALDPDQVEMYPNPGHDQLTVNCSQTINQMTIFNAMGATISEVKVNDHNARVSISALNSGIYFVKIETAQGNVVKKVVKD